MQAYYSGGLVDAYGNVTRAAKFNKIKVTFKAGNRFYAVHGAYSFVRLGAVDTMGEANGKVTSSLAAAVCLTIVVFAS